MFDCSEVAHRIAISNGNAALDIRTRKHLRCIGFVQLHFEVIICKHLLIPGFGRAAGVEQKPCGSNQLDLLSNLIRRIHELVVDRRCERLVAAALHLVWRVADHCVELAVHILAFQRGELESSAGIPILQDAEGRLPFRILVPRRAPVGERIAEQVEHRRLPNFGFAVAQRRFHLGGRLDRRHGVREAVHLP